MSVSLEELKHIAQLAKLEFSNPELGKFASEFNAILDYVSMISECDTSGIDFEHNLQDYVGEPLQPDVSKPSLSKKAALMNATDGRSKDGYIRTSKIVSKE